MIASDGKRFKTCLKTLFKNLTTLISAKTDKNLNTEFKQAVNPCILGNQVAMSATGKMFNCHTIGRFAPFASELGRGKDKDS